MQTEDRPFFRGSELPRLALLALVALGGWAFFLLQGAGDDPRPEAARPRARAGDALPPPDDGPEFRGLLDKTPMSLRDDAAYDVLLKRARATPPAALRAKSRRDVLFPQLIENPGRYRGLPIHLEGTLLRVLRQEVQGSQLFPGGVYFEAYMITPDSQNYPLILVFEKASRDLPVGDDLRIRADFDGYFLKLAAYRAGDTMRFAPVLIGRLEWTRPSAPPRAAGGRGGDRWWGIVLLPITAWLVFRVVTSIRRLRPAGARLAAGRPADSFRKEIEPEELSRWLEGPDEPAEPEDEEPEPWR
jgi:hypothetical protein